jgi:hypothetical protein
MTVLVDFEAPNLVTIRVSGTLRRAEVDAGKHQVHDLMQRHGPCLVAILLEPGFSNLEAFVRWDDIDADQYIKRHIIRLAAVGDLRWRDSALLFLFNTMVPFQIEYFPAAQEEFAKAWLTD